MKTQSIFFKTALAALVWYVALGCASTWGWYAISTVLLALPWVAVVGLWLRLVDARAIEKCQCAHDLPVKIVPEDVGEHLKNCNTCQHAHSFYDPGVGPFLLCCFQAERGGSMDRALSRWCAENVDTKGVYPYADNCPGWKGKGEAR